MAYLLGTSFPGFTALASSEAAGTPVTYAQNAARPFLPWRSTSVVVDGWIRCDFGTAVVLDGVFLNDVNVSSVILQASVNGTTWSALSTPATPIDRRVNRRKVYARLTGFNHRYLRVVFPVSAWIGAAGDEFGAPGYFSCGALLPVASVTALSVHAPVWPRDFLRDESHEIVGYIGGSFEVHTQGRPHASFFLHLRGDRTTTGVSEAALLSAIEAGTPFLLAEDFGSPEHAYYVQRIEDDVLHEDAALLERERFVVGEVI